MIESGTPVGGEAHGAGEEDKAAYNGVQRNPRKVVDDVSLTATGGSRGRWALRGEVVRVGAPHCPPPPQRTGAARETLRRGPPGAARALPRREPRGGARFAKARAPPRGRRKGGGRPPNEGGGASLVPLRPLPGLLPGGPSEPDCLRRHSQTAFCRFTAPSTAHHSTPRRLARAPHTTSRAPHRARPKACLGGFAWGNG